MKKFVILAVLVTMMATLLCACGKFTCDLCREEQSGKKHKVTEDGETAVLCDDCYELYEEAKDLLG